MISIVICGRKKHISEALLANINETVGIEYDLIYIDNSENKYNIFTAYNKGVDLAKYELICFMHDDLVFKTNHWGELVLNHFANQRVGAIGVAGSPYASYMKGPWWSCGLVAQNIIHEYKSTLYYNHPFNNNSALLNNASLNDKQSLPVVVLDGVWFCVRKSLFKTIRFDQNTYSGFHMYDMDISLQLFQLGVELRCVYDIDIAHQSIGKLNKDWITQRTLFFNKWRKDLPMSAFPIPFLNKVKMEFSTWVAYLKILFNQSKEQH